jgi:hypothetical protein
MMCNKRTEYKKGGIKQVTAVPVLMQVSLEK